MVVLLLTIFIDLVGFGIILPILPFFAQAYDASPLQITLLVSTHSGAQIISSVFWGRLSDRYGRKVILLLTLTGGAVAYVWFGFAGSLVSLFLARGFSGVMAGNIAVAQAYLADISTPEERAGAMGKLGAAFGLGFVVGPALGALLIGNDPSAADFARPCLVAAAISIVAVPLGYFLLQEPERRSRKSTGLSSFGELRAAVLGNGIPNIIGLNLLVTLSFTTLMALFPLWSQAQLGWGPREVSFAYAYIGLLAAFMQGGLVGPMTTAWGGPRVLFLGAVALSTGLSSIAFVDTVAAFALNTILLCMGTSFCHPTLTAMISQRAVVEYQGTVMGTANSVGSMGRIIAPPVGGLLFMQVGPNWPMLLAGLLMLPVAVAAAWMSLRWAR